MPSDLHSVAATEFAEITEASSMLMLLMASHDARAWMTRRGS